MTEITWYKRFHGTWKDPKFKAAAVIAQANRCEAISVWDAILDESSESDARGTILNVDRRVIAAGLDLAVDVVTKIWEAFVELRMIVGDRIAKWVKRQGAAVVKLAEHAREGLQDRIRTPGAIRTERWKTKKKERAASVQAEPELPMDLPAQGRVTESVSASATASAVTSPRQTESDKDQERIPPRAPPKGGAPLRVFAEPEILMPIRGGRQDGRHRETAHERRRREYNEAMAAAVMARRVARDGAAASTCG